MKTLPIYKVRDYKIEPSKAERPEYVFAASGLVKLGHKVYVVADDELNLAEFDLQDKDKPGKWFRMIPGDLPLGYKLRKKLKPDLEALVHLMPDQYAPHGALLAVPSMSKENRIDGVLLKLDKELEISGNPIPIDFTEIYKHLVLQIPGLNVEGITVSKDVARLFHRGNRKQGQNAIIDIKAGDFLRDLHDTHTPSPKNIVCVKEFDLGKISGQVLGFTDAVLLDDGNTLFTAAAEDTDDAYKDGECLGSTLGLMNANGAVKGMMQIEGKLKFEGLCLNSKNGDKIEVLLTADTDDQHHPSALYKANFSLKDFETVESALPSESGSFV